MMNVLLRKLPKVDDLLRTPELAEIRLWGGLVRGGTVLALTGALLQAWNKKGTRD